MKKNHTVPEVNIPGRFLFCGEEEGMPRGGMEGFARQGVPQMRQNVAVPPWQFAMKKRGINA